MNQRDAPDKKLAKGAWLSRPTPSSDIHVALLH
jgi:hypothetical protein